MRLKEMVDELGKRCGGEFQVVDGVCTLGIDDMTISLQEIDELGVISTFAEIGEPPPQGLEKLYEAMLAANHLFAGTAGSTISFDVEQRRFYLCRIDHEPLMDAEGFFAMLEKFVNTLETWRKLLADYRPDESAAAAAPPADEQPPLGGFMQV